MKRLTTAQLAPVRAKLLEKQAHVCPLCNGSMKGGQKKPALDHDHQTGYIRDVLCLNCNQFEGKTFNGARRSKNKLTEVQWLRNLLEYWERHETPQHGGILHSTHRTAEEKRLEKNAKARKKRAALKG
jgi:hypothetical protein